MKTTICVLVTKRGGDTAEHRTLGFSNNAFSNNVLLVLLVPNQLTYIPDLVLGWECGDV